MHLCKCASGASSRRYEGGEVGISLKYREVLGITRFIHLEEYAKCNKTLDAAAGFRIRLLLVGTDL